MWAFNAKGVETYSPALPRSNLTWSLSLGTQRFIVIKFEREKGRHPAP